MIKEVVDTLYEFFNSFGIPAHISNYIRDGATMPYITYDAYIGNTMETVPIGVKVWYAGDKLPPAQLETVEKIRARIANGLQIKCGNGFLYIYPGNPFAQPAADENPDISVMYLNINVSFDLN